MTWQWRGDDGNFVDYDPVFAARVEALFKKGALQGEVAYSGTKYTIDFSPFPASFTQKNLESGKVRNIRRNEALWFYFEDNGSAKPYNPIDSNNLESLAATAAASNTATFTFNMFNTNYTIDLVKLTQTNPDSGKVRKIVRRGGMAALAAVTTGSGDDSDADGPAVKVAQVETSSGVKKSVAASLCTNIYIPSAAASNGGGANETGATKSSAAAATAVNYGSAAKSTGTTTTAIMKGGCVVDVHSGLQHTYHVFTDKNKGIHYQCMLNQTNISQNNNKFYVIQLLEPDSGVTGSLYVFTRWGRVGSPGQQALDAFTDAYGAMAAFKKKFREKTQNDWEQAQTNFVKVAGKYHLMDIDLGGGGGSSSATGATPGAVGPAVPAGPIPDSTLPPQLQKVMSLISSKTEMAQVMKELKIDTDKMPLGKISKKQIKEAFEHLKDIEKELQKGHTNNSTINHASSMFYTLVPHNFGFSLPPLISNSDMLKEKMKLLEVMGDLEIAAKLLSEGAGKVDKNPLDTTYDSLKVKLTPLPKNHADFLRVVDYVRNTHGSTHKQYKLVVEEVFEVVRPGEAERYQAYKHLHNKQMLWHGSRTTNFMGILSQGLRIAPPEAPVTGYMYGKGVYFADCSSKSANYCHTNATHNVGFALLCEVALGTTKDYKVAQYMDKPQPGTNSTRGLGRSAPSPSGAVVDGSGVSWPVGKMAPCPEGNNSVLLYPEYIVYDVAQCVMRFMVQLKFEYGSSW